MKATAHLPIVLIGLALVGCQTASTSIPEDAGQPSDAVFNQDTVAPAPDLFVAPDLATPTQDAVAPALDLFVAPDLATSDLATPDAPAPTDAAPETVPDARPGTPDSVRDSTSTSTDLATFCTGGASRMLVNGIASTPSVTGKVIAYDCCDGGEFQITTATFEQPIVVSWQAQSGSFSGFKTIDLANPPSGWSVRVDVGCTSMSSGCLNPVDSYTTGLVGSLALSIGKRAMYDMSVCLHVEESASSLHPLVHSLDLFATHIEAD